MADKLKAGWTPEFGKGMKQIKRNIRIVIISGPSNKPNPVLQKYEVQYAEVPRFEVHDPKKHETKIKFFMNKTDADRWIEDTSVEAT